MSELVKEVEETGINVQELLNSLDNDENQSIIKLTSKKIKVQLNKIISELGLPKEERDELLEQLTEYRHVDEIPDIHYGNYIRWISLKDDKKDDIKLTKGGNVCDIMITKTGVQIKCKCCFNRRPIFYNIKLDENLVFQKMNNAELIILKVLDFLDKK